MCITPLAVIYLDNAATSFPKPPEVLAAIARWFEELGVDATRGTSRRHDEVALAVAECRARLGRLCDVAAAHVVFCDGATAAINLFLRGFLAPGDRVWTTQLEHNAVVRPLLSLRERLGLEVRFFPVGSDLVVRPQQILDALAQGPPPRLFVFSHASNVTGAVQDLGPALTVLRDAGVRILADCAQTAGRLPLAPLAADAYAIPGHKGLHGPPGIGALCLREDLHLLPLCEGGTGSGLDRMPTELPAALESGTANTPGILGWLAGLRWVEAQGIDALHAHELSLTARLRQALAPAEAAGRLRHIGHDGRGPHTAVLSLAFSDLDPHEVAMILEQHDVQVRAGLHCAPYVHDAIGCAGSGTVRVSPGPFNTETEIDRVAELLAELSG